MLAAGRDRFPPSVGVLDARRNQVSVGAACGGRKESKLFHPRRAERFLSSPFIGTCRTLKPGSQWIMERCDGLRRSRRDPMKVAQYEVLGQRREKSDPSRTGRSMAACAREAVRKR